MRKTLILSLILVFAIAGIAWAAEYKKYQFSPTPSDLNDLDHYFAYKWGMNHDIPTNETIIGATLFFDDIRNWDSNPNDMYVNVLHNPVSGVGILEDDQNPSNIFSSTGDLLFRWEDINTTARDIAVTLTKDEFKSELQTLLALNKPNNYVIGTNNSINYWTNLTVYNESGQNNSNDTATLWDGVGDGGKIFVQAGALDKLIQYSTNNILGLGIDPDCHYFNNGVSLTLWTKVVPNVVPEPATLMLFGTGLLCFAARMRKKIQA